MKNDNHASGNEAQAHPHSAAIAQVIWGLSILPIHLIAFPFGAFIHAAVIYAFPSLWRLGALGLSSARVFVLIYPVVYIVLSLLAYYAPGFLSDRTNSGLENSLDYVLSWTANADGMSAKLSTYKDQFGELTRLRNQSLVFAMFMTPPLCFAIWHLVNGCMTLLDATPASPAERAPTMVPTQTRPQYPLHWYYSLPFVVVLLAVLAYLAQEVWTADFVPPRFRRISLLPADPTAFGLLGVLWRIGTYFVAVHCAVFALIGLFVIARDAFRRDIE